MSTPEELELEQLLKELAPTEAERAQLLEEHRQLEKDLLRLADPMPPPDFLHKVMAKVAVAPARAPAKSEVLVAVVIVIAALAASSFAFFATGDLGEVGLQFTRLVLQLRDTVVGLGSAISALWRTAALPLTIGLGAALATFLLAFKRVLHNSLHEVKVVS
ncbi:MAG: hypothetical protein H6Q89_2403 [Myxococcaceae bacterium]|nr:hypothetical protein [Myxococcaceae bacterium]